MCNDDKLLNKLMRATLERYLEPTALKRDNTPVTLHKALAKGWVVRIGRDAGNFPIYFTTEAGRKIYQDDAIKREDIALNQM